MYIYRHYKYDTNKMDNGYYEIKPLNYTTKAIIINKTKQGVIDANKKYLERVYRYNYQD